jgi:hypothetical protein
MGYPMWYIIHYTKIVIPFGEKYNIYYVYCQAFDAGVILLAWRIPGILRAAYLNQSLLFFLPICPYASFNPFLTQ